MKNWHETNDFWVTFLDKMFPKGIEIKTKEEIDKIISLLELEGNENILDLCCGVGRHSLELARRGFNIKGIDRTEFYLDRAKETAKKENLQIEFILEDMRNFCQEDNFDIVLNIFTSFGYFEDINDDKKVLKNVYKSLKQNGKFLIEILGKEVLAKRFRERDWHEEDGVMYLEERKIIDDWSKIRTRWIKIKDSKIDDFTFEHRLFSAMEMENLLSEAGFSKINFFGGLEGLEYDNNASRMIVIASK